MRKYNRTNNNTASKIDSACVHGKHLYIQWINGKRSFFEDESGKKKLKLSEIICKKCGLTPTVEGHDGCLGTLPGVKFACCEHGISNGYIYFKNGVLIRFNKKVSIEYERI